MVHYLITLVREEAAALEVLVNMEGLFAMPLLPEEEVHIILAIPPYMVPQIRQIAMLVVEPETSDPEEQVEPKHPH